MQVAHTGVGALEAADRPAGPVYAAALHDWSRDGEQLALMFRVKRGTRENLGKDWRAKVRRRRWMDGTALVVGALLAWWLDAEPEVPLTLREHWPLMMPFYLPSLAGLVAGTAADETDYQLMTMAAGDRGAVAQYPPVIQAALMRLVRAGAYQRLMPLPHRLMWRLGIPFPPMAFSPWWLNALVISVSAFMGLPVWLYLQYWWNPDFGGRALADAGGMLAVVLAIIGTLVAFAHRETPGRLELPPWRDFRKDWRLRGR